MRLLFLHADSIDVKPTQKAIEEAEEKAVHLSAVEPLVVFIAIEENDNNIEEQAVKEILDVVNKVKAKNVVLYPYVHLTSKPAKPRKALETLKNIEIMLSKKIEVKRAPFGWYKAFSISVKGHPLSELSKEITSDKLAGKKAEYEEEISQSLQQETKIKSSFYILDLNNNLISVNDFNYEKHERLKKLVDYEIKKSRVYEKEPPHIKIMQEHEFVDYEPGSDPGNFRYYPKGRMMKKMLEKYISDICISYGASEVETPIMYDFQHPALKKYLHRFPARQYLLLSDEKKYFLRFAACFGQFLIAHDATISYKHLPFKIYELTRYSFRREQSGELAGLKRLRAFTMPDMHTIVKDIDMAKQEFKNQLNVCISFLKSIGLFEYTEVAFRAEQSFFEQNRKWYNELVSIIGKPIMIELFNERYAYFITKFEFNFIDALNKASALSTVQIDVENAERFDIWFNDEDGKKKRPLILHASFSGAVERVIYALLEKQAMIMENNGKANLPLWISPIQVRVIPVNNNYNEFAIDIAKKIEEHLIRVDVDDREETLNNKIRLAQREWIPYVVVIGEKERKNKKISVNIREDGRKIEMNLEEFINEINKQLHIKERLNMPMLLSKRPIFRQTL